MRIINALSLAPDVINWLANSRQPRILHVFNHACNLLNERREVLSIVTPQIGNGPFNLVIEDDVLFSNHLNAQSPISILADQLILGDLPISTETAKLWSPRPNWEMLHDQRGRIFNGLKSCLSAWKSTETDWVNASIQKPLTNLSAALANADVPAALIRTQQLAGLGQGLTPSGDDIIVGAVLAAWIIHPLDVATAMTKEIANIAASLTTSLSAAWLKSAGRGEAGILWHNFFDALTSADLVQIQVAADNILAIGETSGADALAGFIDTFISHAEFETKSCHS